MDLNIRNFPEPLLTKLKLEAIRRGTSLRDLVIGSLELVEFQRFSDLVVKTEPRKISSTPTQPKKPVYPPPQNVLPKRSIWDDIDSIRKSK